MCSEDRVSVAQKIADLREKLEKVSGTTSVQEIADLRKELEKVSGTASVQGVLHMLAGCVAEGTDAQFAKHCCQFSPLAMKSTQVIEGSKPKIPKVM